jgi:hypothetical protein
MALRLSGLQKPSSLPDGAGAYPAYENPHFCRMALALIRPTKNLTPAGWRCAYPAYKNPHPCRMALALIRPTTNCTLPDKGRDLSGL